MRKVLASLCVLAFAFGLSMWAQPQTSATPEWLRFLGDGSLGAYSCTSGTCVFGDEKWFSSFNVSAGATLVTTATNGPIIVRSPGACTVAGTISNSVNTGAGGITVAGDFGGAGGGGGGGTLAGHGNKATVGDAGIPIVNGGPPGAAGGGNGGAGGTPVPAQYRMLLSGGTFWPVGGGQGGSGGGTGGGVGGNGGGPVILVCDSITFTGTIDVSGAPGAASSANNTGAGGGGGAGYVIFSAVSYPANSGTINLAGGVGGSCNGHTGCGTGGNGGNGWSVAITIK